MSIRREIVRLRSEAFYAHQFLVVRFDDDFVIENSFALFETKNVRSVEIHLRLPNTEDNSPINDLRRALRRNRGNRSTAN